MRSTNTQIMWPPKLKPGTKSKKDPHVRITGSPNSIKSAKEIIFEQLDTRRNRVTLKMDVAFTDHSHIIGKGGRSIQRVMDESGCHIHFPDSNRTSMAEKSNQVSIAGSALGVEQSRCRIREMLPITVQFDLPLNNGLHSPPTLNPQSPQLQAIQQSYGITISFKFDGSNFNTNSYFASSGIITVAVRGTRSHIFGLRQGLAVLIEYLTGFSADAINIPLVMTIDVAVQHHPFIEGRSGSNIRCIMQSTGAAIVMPEQTPGSGCLSSASSSDALASQGSMSDLHSVSTSNFSRDSSGFLNSSDNNNSSSNLTSNQTFNGSNQNLANVGGSNRKTAIIIKGPNFDSVYSAWQELLGCLPLILIFDLREGQDLDPVRVTQLMEQMRQISILIKPKQRQNTKSIVVRGPERDSRLLFEVRRQILDLDESEVPKKNHQVLQQSISDLIYNEFKLRASKAAAAGAMTSSKPSLDKPQLPAPYWASLGFSKHISEQSGEDKFDGCSAASRATGQSIKFNSLFGQNNLLDDTSRRLSYADEGCSRFINEQNSFNLKYLMPMSESTLNSSVSDFHTSGKQAIGKLFSDKNNNSISENNNDDNTKNNNSNTGNDCLQTKSGANDNLSFGLAEFLSRTGLVQRNISDLDYNEFKLRAVKAVMGKPALDKPRVPTPYWAGLGFSKSMSEPVVNDKFDGFGGQSSIKYNPLFSKSNLLDEASRRVSYSNEGSKLINALNSDPYNLKSLMPISESNSTSSIPDFQSPTKQQTIGKFFSDSNNNARNKSNDASGNKSGISLSIGMAEFLARIGLVQYVSLFSQHNIDLDMLFSLSEIDFAELGIPYVHRRKLAIAIAEVKSIKADKMFATLSSFEAAPGAERSKRQKATGIVKDEIEDLWSMQ